MLYKSPLQILSLLLLLLLLLFQAPIGQLNLQDAKLEEIEGACDSDDESDVTSSPVHVFAIWPPCQAPTYLVIPTRQEKVSPLNGKFASVFFVHAYWFTCFLFRLCLAVFQSADKCVGSIRF